MSSDIGSEYVSDFIGGVSSLIASHHLFANFSPTKSSCFPSDCEFSGKLTSPPAF